MRVHSRNVALTVSCAAVVVAAFFGGKSIPLYDGVNLPDEPYRYVDQTAKTHTPSPGSPSYSFTSEQVPLGISVQSNEQGPQIAIYIDASAIVLSTGVGHATFTAQALAPTLRPSDGTIAGNVYRLNGSADNGTFAIRAAGTGSYGSGYNSIALRLPQGYPPNPAIEFRQLTGGPWKPLKTQRIGNDIYMSIDLKSFGDYTLVSLKKQFPSPDASYISAPAKHPPYFTISLAGLLIIMAAIVLYIRRNNRIHDEKKQ